MGDGGGSFQEGRTEMVEGWGGNDERRAATTEPRSRNRGRRGPPNDRRSLRLCSVRLGSGRLGFTFGSAPSDSAGATKRVIWGEEHV